MRASGDVAIAACTRVIDSQTLTGHRLAVVFRYRGWEYDHKGDLERTLADYNAGPGTRGKPSIAGMNCRALNRSGRTRRERAAVRLL
jgi:hypothetical protein